MPFAALLAALAEVPDPHRAQDQRYSLRHLLLFSLRGFLLANCLIPSLLLALRRRLVRADQPAGRIGGTGPGQLFLLFTSRAGRKQSERAMTTAITPEWLFERIGATAGGSVEWGRPVPERGCGVYIITVADAIKGQHVVYIGRTGRPLRVRLSDFYRHRYGDSSPHSGGQEILKLASPRRVHWALVVDYETAEDVMLEAFRNAVGRLPYGNKVRSARRTSISN